MKFKRHRWLDSNRYGEKICEQCGLTRTMLEGSTFRETFTTIYSDGIRERHYAGDCIFTGMNAISVLNERAMELTDLFFRIKPIPRLDTGKWRINAADSVELFKWLIRENFGVEQLDLVHKYLLENAVDGEQLKEALRTASIL